MRSVTLGSGEPEIAVVGGIHGDEPSGVRAIEALEENEDAVRQPVKCIVANERALERGVRDIDTDLNRAFPGDPTADTHEERLAHDILTELSGVDHVVDLHSTAAGGEPLLFAQHDNEAVRELGRSTGVSRFVFIDLGGTLTDQIPHSVAVECARTDDKRVTERVTEILWNTLGAFGVVDTEYTLSDPHTYRVFDTARKPHEEYDFVGENFTTVSEGEVYARRGDSVIEADREFVPVLMSDDGYDEIIGYQTEALGRLSSVGPSRLG